MKCINAGTPAYIFFKKDTQNNKKKKIGEGACYTENIVMQAPLPAYSFKKDIQNNKKKRIGEGACYTINQNKQK
ncbi:MAG: hypothetical protein ACOVNU_13640 [Candidatus Kapaibacteriota bacterium]